MRTFNYSEIKKQKWDSDVLSLIAAIYKEAGKQEMYLKQRPEELEKLVEIAKIQSTEASNAIEGIVTTSTRIKQIVEEKTTPKNCDEQEIAGYRDVLNIIHESFDAIPITQNYILQLHKILYSHMNNPMAGRTKSVQNYISATYPDGHVETLFTPLAPYDTPQALDRICEEFLFGGSNSGKAVNERSAMQMTAVYPCVRILSESIAGLPVHVYQYTDSVSKEKAIKHPLYHLIHDEPNPEMTSFVFRETLMTHLLLYGNAYAQIIRNGKGEVIALYPLMANRMSVDRDDKGHGTRKQY